MYFSNACSDLSCPFPDWRTPPKGTGMNPDAVVVPSAIITLDPDSSGKAALRLYFQNAALEIVGDSMTVTIEDGKFPQGSNHLEVIATDGFHSEGEFFSYQDGDSKLWRLVIVLRLLWQRYSRDEMHA